MSLGVDASPSFPVPLISPVVPGYTGLVAGGGCGGGGSPTAPSGAGGSGIILIAYDTS